MIKNNKILFNLLKAKVTSRFLENHSAPLEMKKWKGDDILLFQEDLLLKVNGRVSEKWFYTYFKNEPEKLPRIDMLNLLSRYVDSQSWNHFKGTIPKLESERKNVKFIVTTFPILIILVFIIVNYYPFSKNEFTFCFYDEDKGIPITEIALDIKIIHIDESPIYLKSDDKGCFNYKTRDKSLMFVVQSPYHKTDTIYRSIKSIDHNKINIRTDYYALMLEYFSNGERSEWEIFKSKLEQIISDDAVIYQLYKNNLGVEIFTKEEFIRKLTVPTKSLKKIKIIDRSSKNGQITQMKFLIE